MHASDVGDSPQTVRGGTALGSGLSWGSYSILLLLSVTLFLFWSGALWHAGPHASHVTRFAVSYGAVIPLALGMLLISSRFSVTRWITAVATIWGIKLVVTVPLYLAFASGGAMIGLGETRPAPLPSSAASAVEDDSYQTAESGFENGAIAGKLIVDPELGEGEALVYLEHPPPGIALPEREVVLTITGGRYDKAIYLVGTADEVTVKNGDSVLHTVRMSSTGVAGLNAPVVAGAKAGPFELNNSGLFILQCANHRGDRNERAHVLVVDHPYAMRAAPDGSFEMKIVPTGKTRILALHAGKHGVAHAHMDVDVKAGSVVDVALRFSEQQQTQQAVEKKTP